MATEPKRLGRHLLVQEGDTLVFRMVGTFTMADAAPFYAIVERVYGQHGRCFLLTDVTEMGHVELEARRYVAQRSEQQIDAIAVVGANAAIRTIAELMFAAIRLMRRRKAAAIEFVKDEAEARRWLASRGARGAAG